MDSFNNIIESVTESAGMDKIEGVGFLGSWTLTIVFLIFLASAIGMAVLAYRKTDDSLLTDRAHHYVTFKIVAIATISYYAMAGGYGAVNLLEYTTPHGPVYRKFFYARYIDWLFTTPLLLLDLLLLADMNYHHTSRILFFDILMIITGFLGAVTSGLHKWGWWVAGCVFMLLIFYDLIVVTRAKVYARSESIGKLFTSLGGLLLILWTCYPVVWALGEGWGIIGIDFEILLYGILDVFAKVVFGWILLMGIGRVSVEAESAARTGKEVEGGSYSTLSTNA
jgi:bacteriorhodopsin